MEIKEQDILYNLGYIVCLPGYDKNLKDAFIYSFKNVCVLENNSADIEKFLSIIKKSNVKTIIFVDFLIEYINVIKMIDPEIEIKFIFTKDMAHLSNYDTYLIFDGILELYNKNLFKHLGVIDSNLYFSLSKVNLDVKLISLDIPKPTENIKNFDNIYNIGLLNNDWDPNHSFYNELSAIGLNSKKFVANLYNPINETIKFADIFNIKYKIYKERKNLYVNQNVNLYINFTNSNDLIFIKSMDSGIPCIVGNTNLLNEYVDLKNLLVVKSDDDIDEISKKIDEVIENKKSIMQMYKIFRNKYTINSKRSIENFLGQKVCEEKNEVSDVLLSVIVPVYNTAEYIDECLDSIKKAKIDNMEVIVINDGSTDNSDVVIKNYMQKHPNFIKYIKQENHGLGNVRNVGLRNAKGKYIASIDSDDSIDKNYFKEALPYLKQGIDMVIYDWLSICSNGEEFKTIAKDYVFNNINEYKGILFTTIMPSTCNKIIKKSLIQELGYKYAEGLKYEDLSLNPLVLLKAKTIKYINKPYYKYKIRENSIMRTGAGHDMIDVIKMLDSRINEQFIEKNSPVNIEEFKYYTYFWRVEEFIFNQLYDLEKSEREKFIEYIKCEIFNILKELYNSNYYLEKMKNFDRDIVEYLKNRNNAFFKNNLNVFIEEYIKNNSYKKLTPPLIFYGKE